jgi:hypothetical protein
MSGAGVEGAFSCRGFVGSAGCCTVELLLLTLVSAILGTVHSSSQHVVYFFVVIVFVLNSFNIVLFAFELEDWAFLFL